MRTQEVQIVFWKELIANCLKNLSKNFIGNNPIKNFFISQSIIGENWELKSRSFQIIELPCTAYSRCRGISFNKLCLFKLIRITSFNHGKRIKGIDFNRTGVQPASEAKWKWGELLGEEMVTVEGLTYWHRVNWKYWKSIIIYDKFIINSFWNVTWMQEFIDEPGVKSFYILRGGGVSGNWRTFPPS